MLDHRTTFTADSSNEPVVFVCSWPGCETLLARQKRFCCHHRNEYEAQKRRDRHEAKQALHLVADR